MKKLLIILVVVIFPIEIMGQKNIDSTAFVIGENLIVFRKIGEILITKGDIKLINKKHDEAKMLCEKIKVIKNSNHSTQYNSHIEEFKKKINKLEIFGDQSSQKQFSKSSISEIYQIINQITLLETIIKLSNLVETYEKAPLKAIDSSLRDTTKLGIIKNTQKVATGISDKATNIETFNKNIRDELDCLITEQKRLNKLIEEKCKGGSTTDCNSLNDSITILMHKISHYQKDSIQLRKDYIFLRDSIKNTVTTISKTTDSIVKTENTIIKDIETLQTEINSLKKDDSTKHIIQLFNASNGLWSVSYSYRLKSIFLCATLGTFFVANNKSFIAALGIGKTYRQFNFESGLLYLHRKNIDLQDKKGLNLYTKVSVVLPSKKKLKFVPSLSFSPAYGIAVGGGIGF